MPKDRYFYLHKIEKEVLEGLYKLGWRYMRLNTHHKLMLYNEAPIWNGKEWKRRHHQDKFRPLTMLTPYSDRIQGFEHGFKHRIMKLVDYLDEEKVYKIGPFLKEGFFNVANQEKYLGGIT